MRLVLALFALIAVVSAFPANEKAEGKMDDLMVLVNKENKVLKADTNKAKSNNWDSYNKNAQRKHYGYSDYGHDNMYGHGYGRKHGYGQY